MGNKINPISLRIGINKGWTSRWFTKRTFGTLLQEDFHLRTVLMKHLEKARSAVERIEIERASNMLRVVLFTSRPGLIIGRGGEGIETLRKIIEKKVYEFRGGKKDTKFQIKLDVEEVKKAETNAALVAQNMADQIEKRIPFRRILKSTLEKLMSNKEVLGAKVMVKGRLDGSEMSRDEWLHKGKVPLHTLRANIDYGSATAFNTYGTVGIKVWIYKGDVFDEKQEK